MENEMTTNTVEEIVATEMLTMPTIEVIPATESEKKPNSKSTTKFVVFAAGLLALKMLSKPAKSAIKNRKERKDQKRKALIREVLEEMAAEKAAANDAETAIIDESTIETIEEETE